MALAVLGLLSHQAGGESPSPVLIQSAPGRFEIAAVDSAVAHGIAAAAGEAWRLLAGPLALPEAFSSPIFVRVVPAVEMAAASAPFHVTVEMGGIVSARLRSDAVNAPIIRRLLVQALLMRIAVAQQGVRPSLTVPLWLEHACAGWWHTRAEAAQLDALKQISARETPPSLDALLGWQRGSEEPRGMSSAAIWLLTFLQSESGRTDGWPSLLSRLLSGDDPGAAVAASYPGRFRSADERELWWQTGYHHLRRVRTLPSLEADESREQLDALARFVCADPVEGTDRVVSFREVLARAGEPIIEAEIARRSTELKTLLAILHPFYRNAGLSLHEAFSARTAQPARRQAACAAFEQDRRDAIELEAATTSALDAWEARGDAGRH